MVVYPFWTPSNETLDILVSSDRWQEVQGSVTLSWYDWEGKQLSSDAHKFSVPSLNNSLILSKSGLSSILPKGHSSEEVWMHLTLNAHVDGKDITNEQTVGFGRYCLALCPNLLVIQFTATSLAQARLVDPKIQVRSSKNLTFTLSARGGVAAWTWLDHPSGTVGYFVDTSTGRPVNGFFLIPGADRTGEYPE